MESSPVRIDAPKATSQGRQGLNNITIASIDHAKQRQKLQELMNKLMSSDEDEASRMDLVALYESLNPAKRSLLPLEYQAILRLKGIGGDKNVPTLQKVSRPPSGGFKPLKESSQP